MAKTSRKKSSFFTALFGKRSRSQRKQLRTALGFVVLSVATLVIATQIDQIQQFLSTATGTPAELVVDTQAVLGPMPRPWRYLAQGGEDHQWRLGGLTPKVAALQPEYIRIDHIYDFYNIVQGTPGNITFDFSQLDLILDDIQATGARPYIALSYMPPAISSGDIVSPPVRWEDWQLTVQKTIEHISGTRGIEDVYYEVWNEPDLFGNWKYYGERNYLDLYRYAVYGANQAQGVKRYKIGGPATTALYKNWFDAMASFVLDNHLRYDFFSWHRYDRNIEQFEQDMADVRQWASKYPELEPVLEFHISEWGHNSEMDAGFDSTYGAAHTAAGAMAMIPTVEKAFIFEIQDGKDPNGQPLWGRWGLFAHNDVGAQTKPRYNALLMLDSIADQRLQITGQGSWVRALAARTEEGNTELVIANFDPYSRHSENVPVTFENIEPGTYWVDARYLDGRHQLQQVATTAAILRANVFMPTNSVAKIEFSPAQSE